MALGATLRIKTDMHWLAVGGTSRLLRNRVTLNGAKGLAKLENGVLIR
jgi:hypothetical protein